MFRKSMTNVKEKTFSIEALAQGAARLRRTGQAGAAEFADKLRLLNERALSKMDAITFFSVIDLLLADESKGGQVVSFALSQPESITVRIDMTPPDPDQRW
jgi:hypothetical protein